MIKASRLMKTAMSCFLSIPILIVLEAIGAGQLFGSLAKAMVVVGALVAIFSSIAHILGYVDNDMTRKK